MTLNPRQFQQLPMFMQAQDLHDSVKFGDQFGGSRQNLMDRKWSDSARSGLLDEIHAYGVTTPVNVEWRGTNKPLLWDGHHRLAVARELDPHTEIPVEHNDVAEDKRAHQALWKFREQHQGTDMLRRFEDRYRSYEDWHEDR